MDCYNCGTTLNRKTRSAEHILPNSIGGKRKAFNLLCKACNEQFGRTIDNELASKLARFYSLLNAGTPTSENAAAAFRKDGNKAAHARFISDVKLSHSFSGSPGYFRAIAKICLNYYLTKGYSRQYIDAVRSFIRGENDALVHYYYAPETGLVYQPAEKEVSHVVHLHGSKESGLLYAYIELYNMQNLICIFTSDYNGDNIDVTYCWDVISGEELVRKLSIGLTREQLLQPKQSSAAMEKQLFPRFERILKLINNH
ncbi:HNH endonuclease [Pseudoflavitalea sp. G-6-1-2]|uniref:HNH endonuclease n=1 Tax=Pseudoflavitalea sp. G-6-1-2 TaxID=2728841 RepID=UPI00146EBF2E|nr:HNH endonuclease [Pseudoflavitalea sp. G-6-1-2]NML21196.1 HNH endonuclease [Pseudoflavitalea sp. G-6-1-2]